MALSKIDVANMVTGAVPVAKGGTALTSGFVNGVSMADCWRLSSTETFSSGSTYDFDANWERADDASFELIGSGLTESSGVFSFQQTGKFLVNFFLTVQRRPSANSDYNGMTCNISSNSGGAYDPIATAFTKSRDTDSAYSHASASCIFDVTSTTTYRMKWTSETSNGYIQNGSSTENRTGFTIIRIGDT